jgi:hypothetical protein
MAWDSADRRKRNELLRRWLSVPDGDARLDAEAGRFVNRPAAEIAKALNAHFGIKISSRTVLRYIKDAVKKPVADGNPSLQRLKPGRPRHHRAINSQGGTGSHLWSLIWCEAMVLTGLAPSGLHQIMHKCESWRHHLGSRSGFHYRFSQLGLSLPHANLKADRAKEVWADGLRLHQIVLRPTTEQACVVLFAYAPRTSYLNATVFLLNTVSNDTGHSKRLAGRPLSRVHERWSARVIEAESDVHIQLSAQTILDFVDATRANMAVPVTTLWLGTSLGDADTLIGELLGMRPDFSFQAQHERPERYLGPEAGRNLPPARLAKYLTEMLNAHNREIAQPWLQAYRQRVRDLLKAGHVTPATLKWLKDTGQLKKNKKSFLKLNLPDMKDVRTAQDLIAYQESVQATVHRREHLNIRPVLIHGDTR